MAGGGSPKGRVKKGDTGMVRIRLFLSSAVVVARLAIVLSFCLFYRSGKAVARRRRTRYCVWLP